MITEYEVTYITKEYLKLNGWVVIAYNPPGSQGTFTIPDPIKDNTYKGQNGSMSPDIVAYKKDKNCFLIVEAKPQYNENDIKKMIEMFSNKNRIGIFFDIIKGYVIANDLDVIINEDTNIIFAKSHGGDIGNYNGTINTILINKKNSFNPHQFNVKETIFDKYEIKSYFSNTKI